MFLKFIELHGNGANWGRIAVGRHTPQEWQERAILDPAHPSLLGAQGWTPDDVWFFDLSTGEAVNLMLGGFAPADLNKHRISVNVLFEAALTELYRLFAEHGRSAEVWWEALPRVLALPEVTPALQGYRRPGCCADHEHLHRD